MSGRPRFRSHFLLLAALLLTTVVQLPTVAWLCVFTRSAWPAVVAAAVSLPYVTRMGNPWQSAGLAPKVALGWWSVCLVFDLLLAPVGLAVRLGAPSPESWAMAGVVALGLGGQAVLGGPRLRQLAVRVAGLPSELDGYRIGQISDVHCGPNTPEHRISRWVSRLNALDLDLMTVTGDLITHGDAYVEPVTRALGALRAKDGVFACMGNHDYFTDGDRFAGALERAGLQVLRNRGVVVSRGSARLFVAGVDDTWTSRDDMERALASRPPGVPTVLLAHDPDLFPQAHALGVELTLSGHTHGGQLAVPFLRRLSLARLITRWTLGLYRQGRSWLYVNRGAGTTGPPVRLGAPAELTVITLRPG